MGLRIAMVAGEASGDLLASLLIRALKKHVAGASFYGIGGPKMIAEGFEALWPCERLAVHGYVDALKRYRELSGIRREFARRILRERPAAFVGIDAPDFNLGLEAQVKSAGIPAIHFVSPSIWAWRGGRIEKIRKSVTRMLCLFPFEPELYQARGVPVSYVGHPLADELPLNPDREAMRERLFLPPDQLIFAMLPGSRQSEVRNLGRLYIDTVRVLAERHPGAQFLIPLATRETWAIFDSAMAESHAYELPIKRMHGHSWDAMIAADAVLVASGTATLEAALLKRPMVITYRIGEWQYRLMKRMAYLPWVGLPNILCNDSVVPEILQDEATPEALADALDAWLADPERVRQLGELFTLMHHDLRRDTGERAAEAIVPYLERAA